MCHSRHHHHGHPARHRAADAAPRDPALRASDAERESAVAQLREHGASGRLELDELEQRIGAAYAARTHGELAAVLTDLPARAPVRAPTARHRQPHAWGGFIQVNLLLVAIWALSGAGYFWPAWVMVWWGLALALKSGPRLLRLR